MFLSTWHPDPIIVSLGSINVYWYGLVLALGALAGYAVILRLGRLSGLSTNFLSDVFVWLVLGGFLGARLYHVTNEWPYYGSHPADIFRVWNGGLAIHGAMIVGVIIIIVAARRARFSPWRLADILSTGLVLGQAIGRWGNYFNQELFGRPTNLPWKIVIDPPHRPAGYENSAFFHPTFLYESLGCLLIFIFMMGLHRRLRNETPGWARLWQTPGTITLTYFVLYSLLRVGMELLRIDRVPVIEGLRLPLLTSIAMIAAALTIWVVRARRHEKASTT